MSAGEEQIGRVMALRGQERAAAIEDLLDSSQLADAADASTTTFWGAQKDSGLPRFTDVREPRFWDDASQRGVLSALGAELVDVPFNPQVAVDDNGRVTPYPKDSRLRRRIDRDIEDAPNRKSLREKNRNQ